MKRYIVEHKYCGARRLIEGNDFYHACKLFAIDTKYWKKISEIF